MQLFGEKLSYKWGKAYVTMLQIIMGKLVVLTVAWLNHKVFQRGGKEQHKHMYSSFLCLN